MAENTDDTISIEKWILSIIIGGAGVWAFCIASVGYVALASGHMRAFGFLILIGLLEAFPISLLAILVCLLRQSKRQRTLEPRALLQKQLAEARALEQTLIKAPAQTDEVTSQLSEVKTLISQLEVAISSYITKETEPTLARLKETLPEVEAVPEALNSNLSTGP